MVCMLLANLVQAASAMPSCLAQGRLQLKRPPCRRLPPPPAPLCPVNTPWPALCACAPSPPPTPLAAMTQQQQHTALQNLNLSGQTMLQELNQLGAAAAMQQMMAAAATGRRSLDSTLKRMENPAIASARCVQGPGPRGAGWAAPPAWPAHALAGLCCSLACIHRSAAPLMPGQPRIFIRLPRLRLTQLPTHPSAPPPSLSVAPVRAGPRIFIGKLTKDTSEADVKDYLMRFGYVMDVYLPKAKDNKAEHRGFGFVTFETDAAIQRVVSHGQHRLKGSTIAIDIAMPKVEDAELPPMDHGPMDTPSGLSGFGALPNMLVQRI